MPRMLRHLEQHPERGLLGYRQALLPSPAARAVLALVRAPRALRARRGRAAPGAVAAVQPRASARSGDVGIWHETYRVRTSATSRPSTATCRRPGWAPRFGTVPVGRGRALRRRPHRCTGRGRPRAAAVLTRAGAAHAAPVGVEVARGGVVHHARAAGAGAGVAGEEGAVRPQQARPGRAGGEGRPVPGPQRVDAGDVRLRAGAGARRAAARAGHAARRRRRRRRLYFGTEAWYAGELTLDDDRGGVDRLRAGGTWARPTTRARCGRCAGTSGWPTTPAGPSCRCWCCSSPTAHPRTGRRPSGSCGTPRRTRCSGSS